MLLIYDENDRYKRGGFCRSFGINTAFEGWESQGERSSVFEEYLEQYAQLQSIMLSYQELMRKDIDAIGKIGTSMLKVDQLLTNLWK